MSSVIAVAAIACCQAGVSEAQLIITRRGVSQEAPENTLAAFRLEWEQQADGIEGDFCLTRDGQRVQQGAKEYSASDEDDSAEFCSSGC